MNTINTINTIKDKERLLKELMGHYFASGRHYDDKKIGSPRVCRRAVALLERSRPEVKELVRLARTKASEAQFERRCYRRGVFYSWIYWTHPECKMGEAMGDPWPAQRWPVDTIVFEVVRLALEGYELFLEE